MGRRAARNTSKGDELFDEPGLNSSSPLSTPQSRMLQGSDDGLQNSRGLLRGGSSHFTGKEDEVSHAWDRDFELYDESVSNSDADDDEGDKNGARESFRGFFPTSLPFTDVISDRRAENLEALQKDGASDVPMLLQDDPPIDPLNSWNLGLDGRFASTSTPSEDRMYFVQMPSVLPIGGRSGAATQSSVDYTGDKVDAVHAHVHANCLSGVPGGHLGKLLIYKSGAVKMKVGDVILDVHAGSKCSSDQSLLYLNTSQGLAFNLGQINQRMIFTPDPKLLIN